MKTVDDCMRSAWAALLRGDYAERDRWVDLAKNIMNAQKRMAESGDPADLVAGKRIVLPDVIHLPDRSHLS